MSATTRERQLRRVAERRGLVLAKSHARDPRATDYGKYQLLRRGTVVFGQWGSADLGFGASLDEIETWLANESKSLPGT